MIELPQATGAAAALCARNQVAPRDLDVGDLQRTLIAQGAELRKEVGEL